MNLVECQAKSFRAVNGRSRQLGRGKLKALVYTVILAAAVYSAYKIVPIYFANYQLGEKIQEQARFAVVYRYSDEQVRDNVYQIVQNLDLPATRDEIKVSASTSIVKISLDYSVPVDLGFYHLELHFSPSSENKSII